MNQFTFNLIKSRGEYFSIMSHGWIQISPEVFQRLSDQLDATETPFSDAGDPVLHATHDLSIPEEPWGASMGVGRVKAHALTPIVGVVIYCPRIATRHHNGLSKVVNLCVGGILVEILFGSLIVFILICVERVILVSIWSSCQPRGGVKLKYAV